MDMQIYNGECENMEAKECVSLRRSVDEDVEGVFSLARTRDRQAALTFLPFSMLCKALGEKVGMCWFTK